MGRCAMAVRLHASIVGQTRYPLYFSRGTTVSGSDVDRDWVCRFDMKTLNTASLLTITYPHGRA